MEQKIDVFISYALMLLSPHCIALNSTPSACQTTASIHLTLVNLGDWAERVISCGIALVILQRCLSLSSEIAALR
ncbi:hypothetical protein CPB85DRAFT_82955 [Mucidula mucida]|nr:hypothetical protein CPB85DRAFT_82955 [Mucidula mucida]